MSIKLKKENENFLKSLREKYQISQEKKTAQRYDPPKMCFQRTQQHTRTRAQYVTFIDASAEKQRYAKIALKTSK